MFYFSVIFIFYKYFWCFCYLIFTFQKLFVVGLWIFPFRNLVLLFHAYIIYHLISEQKCFDIFFGFLHWNLFTPKLFSLFCFVQVNNFPLRMFLKLLMGCLSANIYKKGTIKQTIIQYAEFHFTVCFYHGTSSLNSLSCPQV